VHSYGSGFIGLLRPELYERLLAALPPGVLQVNRGVNSFGHDDSGVRLHMADGEVIEVDVLVGADRIDSLVRRTLWGEAPKREHNLHIFGGFTFGEAVPAERGLCIVSHSRSVQGSWTSPSATRAATASRGGCSAPTTLAPRSAAICTPPRPAWGASSQPPCRS